MAVILCTGFSHEITEEKSKEMGIKAFLFKPILRGVMAETVRRVLDEKDEGVATNTGEG